MTSSNFPINMTSNKIRFLHVSTHSTKLSKKKFRKPTLDLMGGNNYSFLLDGSLFLSKAHTDGTSEWIRYRQYLSKCQKEIKEEQKDIKEEKEEIKEEQEKIKEEKEEIDRINNHFISDPWLKSTNRYYWDVDFSKHKIYIVDNPRDFINLIIDYGYFKFCINYSGFWQILKKAENKYYNYKYNNKKDEFKLSYLSARNAINKFYVDLDVEYDWLISTTEVQKMIHTRNQRNLPLLEVYKHKVVVPKSGITKEFLADLIRSKNYYDNIIGNIDELQKKMLIGPNTFNFYKMNKDGYKGIYFTDNLIKVNTNLCELNEEKNISCKCRYGIGPKEEDVPEVTRVPKIIEQFGLKMTPELKDTINDVIIGMPKWLGSEQLMVWDWVFD
jgi:hypothetical protein